MKYSLAQYVHDGYRLKAIDAEQSELRKLGSNPDWKVARCLVLQQEWLEISARMFRYERHPNNR